MAALLSPRDQHPALGWAVTLRGPCSQHTAPLWGQGRATQGGIACVPSPSSQGKAPGTALLLAPHLADAAPSAGISSAPPPGFYLQESEGQRMGETHCQGLQKGWGHRGTRKGRRDISLTLLGLFLGGLAAGVGDAGDGLDLALADGRGVQHQLGGPGQAHGQPGRTHEDPRDPCTRREQTALRKTP